MAKENMETLRGIVKTITYHNEDNGYTVAKIEVENRKRPVAVTGNVKMLTEGETVVFNGYWVDDTKYGRQFRFHSYESVIPSSLEGIKRFLSSKFIKGIGPVYSKRIVEKFETDTIKVLDECPERLCEVKGISPKRVEAIKEGWASHRHIRDIMIFLQAHDISPAYASRIYDKYQDKTIDKMRKNPYRLIKDVRGIGFIKADQVATKLGIAKESLERIRAGIMYCLDNLIDIGHVYVPLTKLVETAAETLDLDTSLILDTIENLKKRKGIVANEERVYRSDLYELEVELSQHLKRILNTSHYGQRLKRTEIEAIINDIEKARGISFASLQREAVVKATNSNIMVLTGGPGTGKTTTILGLIDIFRYLKQSVMLCAPTGRAAKRLSEATGMEAKTIHRLLEYNPHSGRFTKNEGNLLGTHVVILDEASMVDTIIMTEFLRAVSPDTILIIVGDVDQLPSIGPGNVLRDIIDSGTIPTIRLREIFRQAASSRIVRSAHLINSGKMPFTDNEKSGNFFFIRTGDPVVISSTIVDMVARRLPARYGFDPVNDMQVLSPMHKSETGVINLNSLLQEKLNPFHSLSSEVHRGDWIYRHGDKVMQIRNNYDKMVFNGDIGRIVNIDTSKSLIKVQFDNVVEYSFSELDDLVTAYAISVHKSQGSEFRCVVMPVSTQHYIMLKRNLIYTAVTRARELVVLVGDMKALAIAIANDQVGERFTSLDEKLKENISL